MLETVGAPVIDNYSKEEQLYEDLLRMYCFIPYFIGVLNGVEGQNNFNDQF